MSGIATFVRGLSLGEPSRYQNVTMFPLVTERSGTSAEYELLDKDSDDRRVTIEEMSDAATVPELKLTNTGDRPVLIVDGQELIGAKQNRVLNVTVLAPAHATIVIPVSCVERGRWRYTSRRFATSASVSYASIRARMKEQLYRSIRNDGSRRSDQGQIWKDLDRKATDLRTSSPTRAMSDIYEQHGATIDEFVRAFPPIEGQVGALFISNQGSIALDAFDLETTLKFLLSKLVRSVALDSIVDQNRSPSCAEVEQDARAFLNAIIRAPTESFPSAALGKDIRFEDDRVTGSALVLDERVIHLSASKRPHAADEELLGHEAPR